MEWKSKILSTLGPGLECVEPGFELAGLEQGMAKYHMTEKICRYFMFLKHRRTSNVEDPGLEQAV